ncbi:nascent polypeptide-associated complex subunit alpha, muscle-specific form-like [Sphaeramia orbicularis]|uniref:nascent polypeptide-associated complex subunit alpha, muscle-specific form-like n=1 Tax=Sphaeramia orbicularis TaxID=375764 RepID=UPI0011809166|nr:nascent polypeptide-associated complex subunit alpha, muscle-specific form-like [Sphaeramia orbicularis]
MPPPTRGHNAPSPKMVKGGPGQRPHSSRAQAPGVQGRQLPHPRWGLATQGKARRQSPSPTNPGATRPPRQGSHPAQRAARLDQTATHRGPVCTPAKHPRGLETTPPSLPPRAAPPQQCSQLSPNGQTPTPPGYPTPDRIQETVVWEGCPTLTSPPISAVKCEVCMQAVKIEEHNCAPLRVTPHGQPHPPVRHCPSGAT